MIKMLLRMLLPSLLLLKITAACMPLAASDREVPFSPGPAKEPGGALEGVSGGGYSGGGAEGVPDLLAYGRNRIAPTWRKSQDCANSMNSSEPSLYASQPRWVTAPSQPCPLGQRRTRACKSPSDLTLRLLQPPLLHTSPSFPRSSQTQLG